MKIRFLGATGGVTGSCYCVELDRARFLVDCGVYQGSELDARNASPLPVNPGEIDAVFLTHAHMDHSGRIPLLVKQGFRGPIWTTPASARMLDILWHDSARLMREESEWKTRKALRKGQPPVEPLYGEEDVEAALKRLSPAELDVPTQALEGTRFSFHDAGHILGSASVLFDLEEGGKATRIVFSGDLGQRHAVVGRAPSAIQEADYVLIESTYGDRLHKDASASRREFRDVILTALRDRGKVLIPTFVVDRAQRILFELFLMQAEGLLPEVPIFLDSPMGVKATDLYRAYVGTLSKEVQSYADAGLDAFSPKGLRSVLTPEESQRINDVPFGIVLAGSGMCSGGRIVHHLKHGAWNPKNHIVFVGYQAYGTLGRRIVDGETPLRIAGEEVTVRAQVHTIGGFSAHGDRDDLLAWARNFTTNPLFFVTHGERKASQALSSLLQENGMRALVPTLGQEFEIVPNAPVKSVSATAPTPANDALRALDDISILIEQLRQSPGVLQASEGTMCLLSASRTLLETAAREGQAS